MVPSIRHNRLIALTLKEFTTLIQSVFLILYLKLEMAWILLMVGINGGPKRKGP